MPIHSMSYELGFNLQKHILRAEKQRKATKEQYQRDIQPI